VPHGSAAAGCPREDPRSSQLGPVALTHVSAIYEATATTRNTKKGAAMDWQTRIAGASKLCAATSDSGVEVCDG